MMKYLNLLTEGVKKRDFFFYQEKSQCGIFTVDQVQVAYA